MPTQVMGVRAHGEPWLEQRAAGKGPPSRTALDAFPFTIGRGDTASLQIDSARVSREHAAIERERKGYRIRDLGSTNGTFVNGRRVAESPLEDGDVLLIADEELTFFSGRAAATQATQVMAPAAGSPGDAVQGAADLILAVRRWQETLLRGGVAVCCQRIVRLPSRQAFGYELSGEGLDDPPARSADAQLLSTDCRLAERTRHLFRIVAVEGAAELPGESHLFFRLHPLEIGSQWLFDSLAALDEILPARQKLVALLDSGAASGVPYFREFCREFRQTGCQLAYDRVAAVPGREWSDDESRPEFWRLEPSLLRGLSGARGGPKQLATLVEALRKLGGRVLAGGVERPDEATRLHEIGCDLAQGSLFGPIQPLYRTPQERLPCPAH